MENLKTALTNENILDWIEGYVFTRIVIFGDFIGTVKRSDLLIDLDPKGEFVRRVEGQRIQALALTIKDEDLSSLLGEIEECFQRGWDLLDSEKWTENDFDSVFQLSQKISAVVMRLRNDNR